MASTRRPPRLSMPIMVCTHSYRMAFPALRVPSCPVATCAPAQARLRHGLEDPVAAAPPAACRALIAPCMHGTLPQQPRRAAEGACTSMHEELES